MKIAFFSSSPLSLPLLEKLHRDFGVRLVVTHPDKPVGREQKLTPSLLKTWGVKHKIPCLTPIALKSPNTFTTLKQIKDLKIDLAIVIDYGLLIHKEIFTAPKFQTINIHFSLLPKYRGANPDSFVILNGEKKTGISFVLINEGFDTGDILAQKEIKILPSETAGELHRRLYEETEKIITDIISIWADWKLNKNYNRYKSYNTYIKLFLPPKKQDNSSATYTRRLTREDGYISWQILLKILQQKPLSKNELPVSIFNFFCAVTPWPGLWTELEVRSKKQEVRSLRLKIINAHLEKGKFTIDEVQLEGKQPVPWKQFQEAYGIKLLR